MDFSVVRSYVVGHNERWKKGGEELERDCCCLSDWEKMSEQVLSYYSRGKKHMNAEYFLFESTMNTICQSLNRIFYAFL